MLVVTQYPKVGSTSMGLQEYTNIYTYQTFADWK